MNYSDYIKGIIEAHKQLQNNCVRTSVRKMAWLKQLGDFDVIGKFENQQITGSFKYRGAYNYMRQQKKDHAVIAASAGNHALAIAEAGKKFSIKTTICIPTTASSVKKNRLAAYNHSLIPEGASLEESCEYAINLAKQKDWDYISPYNNPKIIQGQGTVGIEFLEQAPELDTLVVPVGGGGLISGIALIAKQLKPSIKIIGVEPESYNTFYHLKRNGSLQKTPNSPTFADGLAVNLEDHSLTPDIIKNYVDDIVTVNEEEIAAGVLAILYHESQLVEGGGAAGIAAIIAGKIDKSYGKIGVILSGGNITVSNLSKIINYPFTNNRLLDYINVFGEKATKKIALKGVDFSSNIVSENDSWSFDQKLDVEDDISYYSSRYTDVLAKLNKYKKQFDEYYNYCKDKNIKPDRAAIETFKQLSKIAEVKINNIDINSLRQNLSPSEYNEKITSFIQDYRSLLHIIMSLSLVLDWRSASYNQSVDTMFFGLNSQDNPGVNYNRYESDRLISLEKELAQILGINQEKTGVLMTSSGMAAYTLMESYFIRHALKPNDTVLIPQYLYFESDEQISSLEGIKVIRDDTHDTSKIVGLVDKYRPKVVFLDPITNTLDLRMTDIYKVVDKISKLDLSDDIFIAIDGSLMSGELDINKLTNSRNPKLRIIYYDSCSKYLQLGMDIAMGGLVACPSELVPVFDRLRRNTGTILYDFASNIFPTYSRRVQRYRMKRFARNAIVIGNLVEKSSVSKYVDVHYPLLKSHLDNKIACKYQSVGGLMTFEFKDASLNQRESLNSLIEVVLHTARTTGVSITKGVSFGFSIPRISAAAAMAENAGPFLRLSVGDRSYDETVLLAKTIVESISQYLSIKGIIGDNKSALDKQIMDSIYFVNPNQSKKNRKKYSAILASILHSCYGNDYPGTSLDSTNNLEQLSSEKQKTVFWAITESDKKRGLFGTSSMVDSSDEFGKGYAEMGKSGSLGLKDAKYGYGRFILEWEHSKSGLEVFDALVTTVRNCSERPGKNQTIIKAGIGTRIMFLKYFNFEQWGVAPWYLMPDNDSGSYELLDLLFRFRDQKGNKDYLSSHKVAIIDKYQDTLSAFTKLNYDLIPYYEKSQKKDCLSKWKILKPTHKAGQNPLFIVPQDGNQTFNQAIKEYQKNEHSTSVVFMPLTPENIINQEYLDNNGWILTGFIPGRIVKNRAEPYRGMWTRLNNNRPIIEPVYLANPDNLSPDWYFDWSKKIISTLK